MSGCEQFQESIEMRLHGALDAERAVSLDAHLATCATCRAFEVTAKETEEMMRVSATASAGGVDWDKVIAGVEKMKRQYRRIKIMTPIAVVIGAGLLLILVLSSKHPLWLFGGFFAGALPLLAWRITRAHNLLFEAAQASRGRDDLLSYFRKEIDRRVERMTRVRVIMPLMGIFLAYHGWQRAMPKGNMSYFWVQGACSLLMMGQGLYFHFVLLPRLRRERAELG
jgi:hypothetical protein